MNAILRAVATRHPELEVVDWQTVSADHNDWFQTDQVHLTAEGGLAMAHLAHAAVMQIVDPLRVRSTPLRLQKQRAYSLRLNAQGGAPPYRWRVVSGRPPRGFHLLANGFLVTSRTSTARTTVTVAVTDTDGSSTTLQILER
jgi:hypothetical protein